MPGTAGGPSLAVVGHIDEIGVVVTHLGDDGIAAIRPVGGFNPAVMVGQRVDVLTRNGPLPGVVVARVQKQRRGRAEERKALEYDDLFLDVGAKDGDELKSLVRPGDAALWHGAPVALAGNRVASRAFDNRIGCYVALEAARRLAEQGGGPGDFIAVAAVQEEVGDFAGSRTAAFATEPQVALAVDVTHANDVRGGDPEDEGKVVLGGGPTLSRGPSIHPADLRAPPRDRRGGEDPVRDRGLARHDEHRRRRRLPQPPRHRHRPRLGAAPLHALAGRDWPTSRTSSGRSS